MNSFMSLGAALLFSFGVSHALSNDHTIRVNNNIVPMNSNYAHQLNASIGFSTDHHSVSVGGSKLLSIHHETLGVIAISAPFCGLYLGYECIVPLPDWCMKRIGHSGVLSISGVMSEYGLDLNSLRCSFAATPKPKPIKKKRLFHH